MVVGSLTLMSAGWMALGVLGGGSGGARSVRLLRRATVLIGVGHGLTSGIASLTGQGSPSAVQSF